MSLLDSRTPRERALIYGAILLFAGLGLWQFGVKPVLDNKARAEQSLLSAKRDMRIVQAGLPKMGSVSTQSRGAAPFDRPALIETARTAEIAISRVQPGADNSLQVWFEDAPSLSIYKFMNDLRAQYDVSIERVQLTRRESGRVSAQLTLKPLS